MENINFSEEKFKIIFDHDPDAYYISDLKGNFVDGNDAAETLIGHKKNDFIGKNYSKLNIVSKSQTSEFDELLSKSALGQDTGPDEFIFNTKDGQKLDVELRTVPIKLEDEYLVLWIARDITERKKMEESLEWEVEVNKTLAKLSSKLLSSASIEEISDLVLKYAKRLTESEFGFVGYIDPDTGFIVLTTMTRDIWDQCQVQDKSVIFEKFGGLWGWVLDNKESLVTNNPEEDSRSTGTPEGHIKIQRFLSAPALIGEKLVGQVALANSKREYNEQDVLLVERLADIYAIALKRKQSEDALKISEEKYRRIVETFIKRVTEILSDLN